MLFIVAKSPGCRCFAMATSCHLRVSQRKRSDPIEVFVAQRSLHREQLHKSSFRTQERTALGRSCIATSSTLTDISIFKGQRRSLPQLPRYPRVVMSSSNATKRKSGAPRDHNFPMPQRLCRCFARFRDEPCLLPQQVPMEAS